MLKYFLKNFVGILLSLLLVSNCFAGVDLNGDADGIYDTTPDAGLQIIGSMSAFGWFNIDAYNGVLSCLIAMGVAGESTATNFCYELYLDSAGKCHVFWETGTTGTNVDTGAIGAAVGTGSWIHLGFTRTTGATSSVTIYKNGSSLGTIASLTNPTGGTSTELLIGNQNFSTTLGMNGKVSEVAIWDTVLTDQDIANLYSKVKGIPLQIQPANLQGYWALDDYASGTGINGQTYKDLSGNGNNGTGTDADGDSSNVGENVLSYPIYAQFINEVPGAAPPATRGQVIIMRF